MKIWLNDRKVKESNLHLSCYPCVFNRNSIDHPFRSTCLLRALNVRSVYDLCSKGYCYETIVK